MNLDKLKAMLQEAHKATEIAHEDFSKISAVHRAALQIIEFEKELYYGDSSSGRHLQKIKEIIDINVEDIINEIN
ncbi:CxC ATPase DNA modification system associated small protein [Shewanella frigidimarina]|jgi:hypothetical protein|uniref:Uncharacterized protein n=1 Tax=Shewanella frigidimarina (strain NCIMB 400) TaxID=318167 RepID=Q081Y3_SHEFN|nr:CxC ATPase DNA modification system associated small protein [Shewanella frigidimarina]ABI71932.1 hypothetical protein Sfri_2086 [Shewanella frigidimarina NCIMB 400]